MRMIIKNKKTGKSYSVITEDPQKITDALEEKEEEVEVTEEEPKVEEEVKEVEQEDAKKKSTELTDEEITSLKELVELLPSIKALLGDTDKEEEAEEESEKEEEVEEEEVENESTDDVLLETEEEETEEDLSDDEEELVSEEDTEDVHDSKASIGAIEKSFADSNIIDKELDVANVFDLRYKTQLKK